jgi:hypothetical protein
VEEEEFNKAVDSGSDVLHAVGTGENLREQWLLLSCYPQLRLSFGQRPEQGFT